MQKDDGRVISNFINQALENKDLTIYGNGLQTRSFCYVTDMVSGLMAAMFTEKTAGQIINLGNPEEHTVKEMAERIIKMTCSVSKIVYKELPQDDPRRRKPDISRAREMLKWEPKVGLEEGLEKTIEYFKNKGGVVK